jgi:hypothetical protein
MRTIDSSAATGGDSLTIGEFLAIVRATRLKPPGIRDLDIATANAKREGEATEIRDYEDLEIFLTEWSHWHVSDYEKPMRTAAKLWACFEVARDALTKHNAAQADLIAQSNAAPAPEAGAP